ncbi:nucleoside deaminase [Granulosicoccus sp.]|jgi:tRNA(Arg) A34 adenosine deaminase TadA|nr:nucleoside deaminase [Granulosicoccus sp.]MDB4223076.1 nucleoside deaminase [Granulosicoccus sp.]
MSAPDLDTALVTRLLDAMALDIVPMTEKSVMLGNKIFGAALLKKSDLGTYLAETNNEMESPLHHGEMHLLKRYFEQPVDTRLAPSELLFLTTHEPCSLCLSAITWAGFDNFYYFFSHEDSRDEFAIPHDLKILKEVFDVDPGQYCRSNAFWISHGIQSWFKDNENTLPDETRNLLQGKIQHLKEQYAVLSNQYQSSKSENQIPLN